MRKKRRRWREREGMVLQNGEREKREELEKEMMRIVKLNSPTEKKLL